MSRLSVRGSLAWWLLPWALGACADDKGEPQDSSHETGGRESGDPDTHDPVETGETSETGETGAPCVEDADGELPEGATWISFDGVSADLYSFDRTDFNPYTGYEGTYDLNAEIVYGANGFKLERPGTVVGVAARWDDLGDDPTAATVTLWPDFGSDGYVFDYERPYGSYTRCLTSEDEEAWVEYILPETIRIDEPLHVFAGYGRDPEDELQPDILFENTYNEAEPFYAGARFPNIDDRSFYLGAGFPWYTWQVRLAVVYDDEIPAEDKPFQVLSALSASSRVAWGDYDGDGDDDLMSTGPALYQNDGAGNFTDVSATALAGIASGAGGGVWGDYDNDGCLDYFGEGNSYAIPELLLHNRCDGTFEDLTTSSGIVDTQELRDCNDDGAAESSPTEGAAWFDLDNDGFLDLYLANYECPEYSDSSDPDYFGYYRDRLWRNNGDGTFSDWTDTFSIDPAPYAGRGVTTGDVDLDGWTDLFVSNYRLNPNFFYKNDLGTLTEIAGSNGTQGTYRPRYGAYGHTIGSAFGDIDNDGDLDLISANLAHPFYYHFSDRTQVLINDGSGQFTDEAEARGIYYRETHSNPTLFDADNDGDLDLFITSVYPERDSDLYLNDGAGNFTLYNYGSGLLVRNGWGSAAADVDQDGDQDVVAYSLFNNTGASGGWLEVTVVGGNRAGDTTLGVSNRAGIGAVVQLTAGGVSQLRQVSGGSGTANQDSLTQHFGLGDAEAIDALTVLFPGGAEVTVEAPSVNTRVWVCEDGRWSDEGDPCT